MNLEKFLVEAKKNTYASDGEGGEKRLGDGSKELTFEKSGYTYRDRYFGFNPFLGEEVVFDNNGKAIWGMNYYGLILSENVEGKELYSFLQEALKLVAEDRPFRGPEIFKIDDWRYIDKSAGDLESFQGVEEIYYQQEKVYELTYHGGKVVK